MNQEKDERLGDFVIDLGGAIRANPLPSALIGMGLIWLFTGGGWSVKSGIGAAIDGMSSAGTWGSRSIRGAGEAGVAGVTSTGESFGGGGSVTQRPSTVAPPAGGSVALPGGQLFATARSNIANLMQKQPLLLGAVGLLLGAGVAASASSTVTETELMGDVSTKLQGKARDIADAAARRVADVMDGVATTVEEDARAHGLTPENLKRSVSGTGAKIERVIGQSAKHLQSQLN